MAESSDAIDADGKWSVCLPGCKISGAWLFDMKTMLKISSLWFSLVAVSYCLSFFEMDSNILKCKNHSS
jgi:hypothetical protein